MACWYQKVGGLVKGPKINQYVGTARHLLFNYCIQVVVFIRFFYFYPDTWRAQGSPQDRNILEAPVPSTSVGTTRSAHPRSPAWHRHLRKRRSEARARLRAASTGRYHSRRLFKDLHLLANHHSRPQYKLGMSWNPNHGWRGNYWGGGRKTPKKPAAQAKRKPERDTPKVPEFPSYDAMAVADGGASGSGGSSSAPSSTEKGLKQLVRALVEQNAVTLPEEAKALLQEEEETDVRLEIRRSQTMLNKRRKAHGRVLRLREALKEKHAQYQLFREKMREQLLAQQEKFEEDVKNLEKSIAEAEEILREIEKETDENKDEEMQSLDNKEPELEQLLDISNAKSPQVVSLAKALEHSKSETATTKKLYTLQTMQLQTYMKQVQQLKLELEAHQPGGGTPGEIAKPLAFPSASPQMAKTPRLPRDRDPLSRFRGTSKTDAQNSPRPRSRSTPQRTEPSKTIPGAQVIEDSPPKVSGGIPIGDGMD